MVDLDGKPYTALKSAFLFRTKYDAACTCKPQPWSKEALARHRAYADAEKKSGTQTHIVARTVRTGQRPEPHQAGASSDASGTAARARPNGAMLLGADQRQPPSASRRGGSHGRRNDWQHRAFTGD